MTDTGSITTPTREVTDHKAHDMNEALSIHAIGPVSAGGANTDYEIEGFRWPLDVIVDTDTGATGSTEVDCIHIKFQDGSPAQSINGITNEALLAIVIDRLRGFQSGPFSCRENALALTHAQESLMWLQLRSRNQVVPSSHAG